jgi:hypothetical protein
MMKYIQKKIFRQGLLCLGSGGEKCGFTGFEAISFCLLEGALSEEGIIGQMSGPRTALAPGLLGTGLFSKEMH